MGICVCAAQQLDFKALHDMHHLGVDQTLYLARKTFPRPSRMVSKRLYRHVSSVNRLTLRQLPMMLEI